MSYFIMIAFDEHTDEFMVCLVNFESPVNFEESSLHTTSTLEGAIVHAHQESAKIAARLGKEDPLMVVVASSVAEKCLADGYDGDVTFKDRPTRHG